MSDKTDKTDSRHADYRATLFLPATDFPMKAGLPAAEPKWLARWAGDGPLRPHAQSRQGPAALRAP